VAELEITASIVVYWKALQASSNAQGAPVKANLHPPYRKITAVCACGNQFETRSTSPSIHVEVCSQCHPYFTGKQRLVDTAGRVDRFRRKYQTDTAAASQS
jgi:large subunit ribosomal protein L31